MDFLCLQWGKSGYRVLCVRIPCTVAIAMSFFWLRFGDNFERNIVTRFIQSNIFSKQCKRLQTVLCEKMTQDIET